MNNCKLPLLACVGLTASACSHNSMNFRPTMGADPTQIGYEAQALINQMRKAYVEKADCNEIRPSVQNTETEAYRRLEKSKFSCVTFIESTNPSFTPAQYYEAGLLLSDLYCDDYFRRIADHKQKRQFGRSTTNDIGTAASVALGLASAGSIVTGGAGAAFGLADNLFRNYDAAFVVEPNLGKMLKLVKTAQQSTKERTEAANLTSYFEAHRAIADYSQHCSYVGMDALLDRAIEEGTKAATVDDSVTKFQTASERRDLQIEEEKARLEEEKLKAIQRQDTAKKAAKAVQDTPAEPADQPAEPPAEPPVQPPGGQ